MALNIPELMTSLGRIGHTAYLIDIAQAGQPVTFDELSTEAWMNQIWITTLTQVYDTLIRSESAPMGTWQQAAITILLGMVEAANPTYGGGVPNALAYLYNQMVAQGQTVKQCVVGSSYTPYTTNIGSGNVFIALTRGDGILYQNTVAEVGQLSITRDSFTGGATVGQEPWLYVGVPNLSSLGTNTPVGIWDWDSPQGSGAVTGGNCISASQYASNSGNFLTNGNFAAWAGVTPAPNNWNLLVGTWGTTAQQSSTSLGGSFSVQFNAGDGNQLTQQFGSSAVSGVAAGTSALPTSYRGYANNVWLMASGGTMSGGELAVSLINANGGAVFSDQSGNPNTHNISLAGLSSLIWTPSAVPLRLPVEPPENFQLSLSTVASPPAGANLLIDCVSFAAPILIQPGGFDIAVFSNPSAPFHSVPINDGWAVTLTNDRGSSQYLATLQALLSRLFQSPGFIAPYSLTPTLLDTLITNP